MEAKVGDQVIFYLKDDSYNHDLGQAKRFLTPDGTYIIERVENTPEGREIFLEEFQGVAFNSAVFEKVLF